LQDQTSSFFPKREAKIEDLFTGIEQPKHFRGRPSTDAFWTWRPNDGALEADKVQLLVDGTNVANSAVCGARVLFALVHIICLRHKIRAKIVFDGPSFGEVVRESGGAADWEDSKSYKYDEHPENPMPEVEFVGYHFKDAADIVIREMAVSAMDKGYSLLVWTGDKNSVWELEELTNQEFKLVRTDSHPFHALRPNGAPEWPAVVTHPITGGGVRDLVSHERRESTHVLHSLQGHWNQLVQEPSVCDWMYSLWQDAPDNAGFVLRKHGILKALLEGYANLSVTPHGSKLLSSVHSFLDPAEAFALAEKHLDRMYDWSFSEDSALVVRTLLRKLRKHPKRTTLLSFIEGRWPEMVLDPHAQSVARVLISTYLSSREIVNSLSQSLGPSFATTLTATAHGTKVLEAMLMYFTLRKEEVQRLHAMIKEWALNFIKTNRYNRTSYCEQGELIHALVKRSILWAGGR
jgi:hypothetical protein